MRIQLLALFAILFMGLFACRKNVQSISRQKIEEDETIITEKAVIKEQLDFMIFGSMYTGDYGMAQVLGNTAEALLLQQNYVGGFVRKSHIERTTLYNILGRHEAMTILLFDFPSALRLAKRYSRQAFALPYSFINPQNLPPNLRTATIRLEEGAFLAGIAAAKVTRNSRVGMLIDLPERQSQLAVYAFVQGVLEIEPDAGIVVIRSDSDATQLENHTTRIISAENIDAIFAMSMNYNNAIIRSAYDSNPNVLIINSFYDAYESQNAIPPNVLASLLLSLEPVISNFIRNASDLKDFSALPQVQSYGLTEENIMTFSWEGQEERPEYRELSRAAQREVAAYTKRIRSQDFEVFNALKDGIPPAALQNFRFQDLRRIHALH